MKIAITLVGLLAMIFSAVHATFEWDRFPHQYLDAWLSTSDNCKEGTDAHKEKLDINDCETEYDYDWNSVLIGPFDGYWPPANRNCDIAFFSEKGCNRENDPYIVTHKISEFTPKAKTCIPNLKAEAPGIQRFRSIGLFCGKEQPTVPVYHIQVVDIPPQ